MATSKKTTAPKEGDLQVWWVPQVPMDSFTVSVPDVKTGVLLMKTLADYDRFQFEKKVKPDYCNMGGLNAFEDGEWVSWVDEETGEDDPEVWLASSPL